MKKYIKIKKRLIDFLSKLEDTEFIDYFDYNCIIYGRCLIDIYNNKIPSKINILCSHSKFRILNQFFSNNEFKKDFILENKYQYRNNFYTFNIIVDGYPIKNFLNYIDFKIEEIYFDGEIKICDKLHFLTKLEIIKFDSISSPIFKYKLLRSLKYINYDYKFKFYNDDITIFLYNNKYNSYFNFFNRIMLKHLFIINIIISLLFVVKI